MIKIKLIHVFLVLSISIILILLYILALSGVIGAWISYFIVILTGIMILGEKIKKKERKNKEIRKIVDIIKSKNQKNK